MIFNSPVYPIPPSFINDELELNSTHKYLNYLSEKGAKTIMSTAGTSQFNLLTSTEVDLFNNALLNFKGKKIIGLPAISFYELKQKIRGLNYKNLKDVYLLILFPERYYNDEQIIKFFEEVCNESIYPILAHGNTMRKGMGGEYSYSFNLLKKLSKIKNFIGIKEESPSIDFAQKNLKELDLEIIVAGGSMKRFWSLEPFGATTYLTGVGSFNPTIEENFYNEYTNGSLKMAKEIIKTFETPLFRTFMKVGWHASMREALKNMGFILDNRKPFIILSDDNKEIIKQSLEKLFQ
jgi:dihydrodipicolinate synthase/N-acetylneuraminate lyase